MKCLDEGVDVPRSELAIFCASTGNPRQFIQRRGRVLRTHNDKINAVIHDLVVVPQINRKESYYEMERNLLKKEIERVVDFSELSMNKIDTYEVLQEILDYYNLNLNDFKNE
jgi:superfamily II DNA or RNA helicase